MSDPTKSQIIAASSTWLAALLNFLPGLGTGYLYQRRWKAYWITNIVSAAWVYIDYTRELSIDPSDPASLQANNIGILGLIVISTVTAFEAVFAIKREREVS